MNVEATFIGTCTFIPVQNFGGLTLLSLMCEALSSRLSVFLWKDVSTDISQVFISLIFADMS